MRVARIPVVLAIAGCLAAVPAAPAAAAVPGGFFGVNVDGPAVSPEGSFTEAPSVRASGTRNVRVGVYWSQIEPTQGAFDTARLDAFVLDAARQGLTVLPVLQDTPAWAAKRKARPDYVQPPRGTATFASFVTRMVARYGPRGTLWSTNPAAPRRPIRTWQIWNEPDVKTYWDEVDWSPGYAKLLRAAHGVLKRADPGSVVVAAGLTNQSWSDLRVLYFHGARGAFDVAALHPYTAEVPGVIRLIKRFRAVMKSVGDRRVPLMVTEAGWSSGQGVATYNYGWETTEAGQAAKVRQLMGVLAEGRSRYRLAGAYWYTWMTVPLGAADSFRYTGLRRVGPEGTGVDKPALEAWRTTLARLTR